MNEIKEKLFDLEHDCWNSRNYSNMFAFTAEDIDDTIEETSKAKDEKFIKILDKLIKKIENADKQIEFDEWETFMIFNIQEIKQRIKEE